MSSVPALATATVTGAPLSVSGPSPITPGSVTPLQAAGTLLDHALLAAGLPSLLLLATVAALLSGGDALSLVDPRWILAGTGAVGMLAAGLGAIGVATGSGYAVPALLAGVGILAVAGAVVALDRPVPAAALLVVGTVLPAVVGIALDARVGAFGWGGRFPVPVQSVALAVAPGAFLPLGHAAARRSIARWPLAAVVVAAPLVVVAPLVPIGGFGPFFVALVLTPWSAATALLGVVGFALGWVASTGDGEGSAASGGRSGVDGPGSGTGRGGSGGSGGGSWTGLGRSGGDGGGDGE